MKSLKKALLYAFTVSLIINGFGFLIAVLNANMESALTDFKRIAPISISILFIPCFLSGVFYRADLFSNKLKALKYFFLPAVISFGFIYAIVFFTLLPDSKPTHKSLYIVALFNGVLSMVITVFSILIYYLLNKKKDKRKDMKKLKPSFLKVLLIFFSIALMFNVLVFSFGNSSWVNFKVPFLIVTKGFVITIFSFFAFQYAFNKNKESYVFVLIYIVGILVIPFVFTELYSDFSFEVFVKKLNIVLTVIAPYFLLIMLAVHVYFIYLKNEKEKESLRQTSASTNLKYQQLKAQLSPHFLFNNISVLTGLIEESSERAIEFSEKLSSIYRYLLDQEKNDLVLLDHEIVFGKQYMDLLQVRYDNSLAVTFNLDVISEYYILPFSLQIVFENIIKHNVVSMDKPMKVNVSCINDFLIIENTLHLKSVNNSNTKIGLENLKKRYAFFTDKKVEVSSDDSIYCIKLPLLKMQD
ncbi:sensor histidine kinase [Hanstruepera marina]|uniref:sensor histidine kinase n=1 Tax=Hanstruepera marina TaxID=2873265 RepID=UPI001CA77495|nr:histidine kinase [Hanstruepera marina]